MLVERRKRSRFPSTFSQKRQNNWKNMNTSMRNNLGIVKQKVHLYIEVSANTCQNTKKVFTNSLQPHTYKKSKSKTNAMDSSSRHMRKEKKCDKKALTSSDKLFNYWFARSISQGSYTLWKILQRILAIQVCKKLVVIKLQNN